MDYSDNGRIIKPKPPHSQNSDVDSDEFKRLDKIFKYMLNNKSKSFKAKKEDEELYYSDVEETRTQFTKQVLDTIKEKYNIPISTKVTFAIVEQTLSFLSGAKPKVDLMAQEESVKDWVMVYKRLIDSLWYENDVSMDLMDTLRDMCTTGSGYIHVRPNSFYNESTFGVSVDNVPWTDVYIDPGSREFDHHDADFMCIARVLPRKKAEREYDITIERDESNGTFGVSDQMPLDFDTSVYNHYALDGKDKYDLVWERYFYEKELVRHYISPEGFISLKKPIQTMVPNPEKQMMAQQLMMLEQQSQQQQQSATDMMVQSEEYENANPSPMMGGQSGAGIQQEALKNAGEQIDVQGQLRQAMSVYEAMPDMIQAFVMEMENGSQQIVMEYIVTKKKRIKATLLVGTKILKKETLPTDVFPIIPFHYSKMRNPYRTFGIIHQIKDVQKAINKLWGLLIYDMQLRASLRVFYANNTIADPKTAETKFGVPGAFIGYDADPSLPNGGKPEIVDISSANQAIIQLLNMLQQLAEYVTGIYGVVQGNPDAAPGTFSGTQALQTFGTQRIKLASRTIESSLSVLGYVLVSYLQRYCSKEKISELMGDKVDPNILDQSGDFKFKVRVSIAQTLPTSRQMAANALSTLAGQLGDPQLQQVLTQYALKFLDIQEAEEISEVLNTVQQLQQQIAQQAEQLDMQNSQMKAMQNNALQKDMSIEREKAKAELEIEKNNMMNEINNQPQEQEEGSLF